MNSEASLPPLVAAPEPKAGGLETGPRRTSSRRFSTRSALRSRGRRVSAKKLAAPRPVLPRISRGDEEDAKHLNLEIQRQKLSHALESPNIVQSERPLRVPHLRHTAISHHTKFRSQIPSASADYPGKSPYAMEDGSPHKYFMSGYQGNVPRYRYLVGGGFPLLTHDALNEFSESLRLRSTSFLKPIDLGAPQSAPDFQTGTRCVLYRSDTGIIPNYKGHIPGHKFRFGRTFGEITKDARGRGLSFSVE